MRRSSHSLSAPGKLATAAWRQGKHIAQCKIQLLLNRNKAPVHAVYFYPEAPHPYTVVYRVLHALGVSIKRGLPAGSDAPTFYWEDVTLSQLKPDSALVNSKCVDISKSKVDEIHAVVFGYALRVDPLRFSGKIVRAC